MTTETHATTVPRGPVQTGTRSRLAVLAAGGLWGLWAVSGCADARVGPAAFELAKALDTVCNLENADQLPRFRELAERELQAGRITDDEFALLTDIADTAAAGAWDEAEQDARELLADQTRRP